MDTQLFIIINNLAGNWRALDVLMIFFAKYFLYFFAAGVLLLWLKKDLRNKVILAIVSSVISRLVIVQIIKMLVSRSRPYGVMNIHQLIADNEPMVSFPSGHAVIFFSIAFAFFGTKYFWPMMVLAFIGSIARVFVGVHYPADILASIIIARAVVWGIKPLFKKWNLS